MYQFIPPSIKEGPAGLDSLFYRIGLQRGISVLKIDGTYYQIRTPSQDEIKLAQIFYQGGHIYTVSDSEAADLTAAGYEVTAL
jgi:hypothetical protein